MPLGDLSIELDSGIPLDARQFTVEERMTSLPEMDDGSRTGLEQ